MGRRSAGIRIGWKSYPTQTAFSEPTTAVALTRLIRWYFGNPSAVSLGQTEFVRIWGDIPLEDNWQRSLRSSSTTVSNRNVTGDIAAAPSADTKSATPADPAEAEYARISKELPKTEEQKAEALAKIEEAYFNLGDIYYFKLLEKENAIISYNKLLERFPDTEYEPEILYKLYLIYKETDQEKSDNYAQLLKTKHPTSTFARILINPDYLKESSQAVEKQKVLYDKAYSLFKEKDFPGALQVLDEASALGSTTFTPNLDLLKILIVGQTEDISQYQYQLEQFVKANPDTEIGNYANQLLTASRNFIERQEQKKGIQYIRSLEEPHYFVMVYKQTENMGATGPAAMEKFNQKYFNDLKLKTSTLLLNDDYALILIADLPRVSSALEYIRTFNEKLSTLTELRNHKFHSFVITKDNFDIFYRTKGLDEYLQFFEKNYPTED